MIRNMKHRLGIVAIVGFFALPFYVQAAPQYTVSPLIIDTPVEARDIISKEITVTNTGGQPVTVYPTVNNISLMEGGTIDVFLPPVESDRTQSLASWIEISRLGIDLAPGESKMIPLTLRINPTPIAGTYHTFIGFGTGRNRDEAEKQVMGGQAPGTIVTVTLSDKKNEFLKLSKFIVERFVTSAEKGVAAYVFKNPGDEILVPKGEIILYNSKGNEVGLVTINDENIAIPPGGEHVFTTPIPTENLFGKYKAFLSVEYGKTQRGAVHDTAFFYVFPLKIVLILIIVIILVGIIAFIIHKKYLHEVPDDADRLEFHVRDTHSESKDHDVVLKQK